MWSRSGDKKYIYDLQCFHGEYMLVVTDMCDVYYEELSSQQISTRGESLEFALSSETQVEKFCGILREKLATNVAKFNFPNSIIINDAEYSPPLMWTFELKKMSDFDAKQVFSNLCTDLFAVIEGLGGEIDRFKSIVVNKNLIIRGLDDAVQRKIEYRVPRHLEEPFSDRRLHFPKTEKDALSLSPEFWPSESEAKRLKTTNSGAVEKDADSQAETQ